jgi:hypothetical protein
MRYALLSIVFLAACGGGTAPTLESAALRGLVYEVDGQSDTLSGVEVALLETGDVVMTDDGGNFTFTDLEAGTYTLVFDTSLFLLAEHDGEHERDGRDEAEDEAGHPRVEVIEGGGDVEVEIALANGEVKDFSIAHKNHRHAKAYMEGFEDSPVVGKIKLDENDKGQRFRVIVEHLEAGSVIEVFIRQNEQMVSVGTAVADTYGEAVYRRDTAEGDSLPLGVDHLDALAGRRIEVRLADSEELLLVSEVPELPAEPSDKPEDEKGEDEKGEDEKGEDGKGEGGEDGKGEDGKGEDGKGEDGKGEGGEDGKGEGGGDGKD